MAKKKGGKKGKGKKGNGKKAPKLTEALQRQQLRETAMNFKPAATMRPCTPSVPDHPATDTLHDALVHCCAAGDLFQVQRLLALGAVPDAKEERHPATGYLPLHVAAKMGYDDVVEILLNHGAGIDSQENPYAYTALHLAAVYGARDVVLLLLERGADEEKVDSRGRTPRQVAFPDTFP